MILTIIDGKICFPEEHHIQENICSSRVLTVKCFQIAKWSLTPFRQHCYFSIFDVLDTKIVIYQVLLTFLHLTKVHFFS